MSIDPRISTYVHVALFVLAALGSGTLGLPPGVDAATGALITKWALWITAVYGCVGASLSAANSGPLTGPATPAAPKASAHWVATLAALAILPIGLAGCLTIQQVNAYTAAVQATGNVLKTIGQDLVAIDCQSAELISVIAKDANAAARVQATLNKNAAIARDACPALTGAPAVQVVSGG